MMKKQWCASGVDVFVQMYSGGVFIPLSRSSTLKEELQVVPLVLWSTFNISIIFKIIFHSHASGKIRHHWQTMHSNFIRKSNQEDI